MRNPFASIGRRAGSVLLTLLVVGSVVGAAAAPAVLGAGDVNFGSDYAPNPGMHEMSLEKATHEMGSMGLLDYQNDNGEVETLNAHLNDSEDNPVSLRADKINASDYARFPGDKDVSSLDASEWTNTDAELSVTDTETAPGVEALRVSSTGVTGANSTTFSNFSVDSDANKRFAQFVVNVDSIDAGATVDIVIADRDGDDKVMTINASRDRSAKDVIANATGAGIVYQHQLGDLSTTDHSVSGTGDGSFDDIQAVHIVVDGGDADVTFAGMNAEKMRTWNFGERLENTDDDDALETVDIDEPAGYFSVTGLDTLGSTFDSATVHDVRFPVIYSASDLDSDSDVTVNITETAEGRYPGFEFSVDSYYRLTVPQQYDLVHSGLSLDDEQTMPSDRYKTVEYAEGVSDTEFDEISSWSDVTSAYSAEGGNVTLDSTIEPGQSYAVHYHYVVTGSNVDDLRNVNKMGGGIGGGEKESDGIIGSILAVLASIAGMLGLSKVWGRVTG